MRRRYLVAGLAVAAGTGMWALPAASAGGGDHDNGHGDVFRVISHEVDSADLDLGKKGFSLGDRFVFSDNLSKHGKVIGSDHGECVITRIQGDSGAFQCAVTAVFNGKGQITVQGVVQFTAEETSPFTLAVTGGTGKFRDAGGQVVVDESAEEYTVLTFKLTD
jgi:hypothetical protein